MRDENRSAAAGWVMTLRRFAIDPLFLLIAAALLLTRSAAQTTTLPQSASARFFVLYDFGNRPYDPILQQGPSALVEGCDGSFYTTSTGGGNFGYGTVFKISPTDGKPPFVLYNFDLYDGAGPKSGLVRGNKKTDCNLYGTTYEGGKYGAGTIFSITPDGTLTTLWDFRNGLVVPPPVGRPPTEKEKLDAAAAYPVSAPVQADDGSWYGVASYADHQQWGVIYHLSGGHYDGLYQFKPADAATNGFFPVGLSKGTDGSFYGTTLKGGLGYGTIYKLTNGAINTIFKFDAPTQGSLGVIEGNDVEGPRLFGTATGPPATSFGFVYSLTPSGQEFKIIHMFGGIDGAGPSGGLVQDKDGALYGATSGGGSPAGSRGVFYRLKPDGSEFSALFNMNFSTGRYAYTAPIGSSSDQAGASSRDFYGMTYQGGVHDAGVFYHVNVHMYPTPSKDSAYAGGLAVTGPGIPDAPTASTSSGAWDTALTIKGDTQAFQADASGTPQLKEGDGIMIELSCPRDPHIVQFIYREMVAAGGEYLDNDGALDANGNPLGGYGTRTGRFPLTTDPKNPIWHTDTLVSPNAYYDQSPWVESSKRHERCHHSGCAQRRDAARRFKTALVLESHRERLRNLQREGRPHGDLGPATVLEPGQKRVGSIGVREFRD
jgi:uncharacterized repeat protein (TIGR03803 family)